MRVLGIDPGSIITGYGIVDKKGESLSIIKYGIIRAKVKQESMPLRLREIYNFLNRVILSTKPEATAIETIFFAKNVQSTIKLAYSRAAAMLSATTSDIPVFEYSPREVKKSVTGRGNAGKEQVRFMVKTILNIKDTTDYFDASDALAVAICHCLKSSIAVPKSNNWNDFIKQHPERVVKM